jgi:uncharacterized membrane protein YgdD (TMEM256/DUF423 family)
LSPFGLRLQTSDFRVQSCVVSNLMANTFMLIGSLAGFLGVAAGAFGAHALRSRLSSEMLAVFETAVRYQMYHALALLITAAVIGRVGDARLLSIAGWSFITGVVLFSGSLYGLALSGMSGLGAITPLGGVAFLLGWGCLALFAAAR